MPSFGRIQGLTAHVLHDSISSRDNASRSDAFPPMNESAPGSKDGEDVRNKPCQNSGHDNYCPLTMNSPCQDPTAFQYDSDPAHFISNSVSELPPMPIRFLVAECCDMKKAALRWKNTVEWRRKYGIDLLLHTPHDTFDIIKQSYKHYFHLPDRLGHAVYYEIPGMIDFSALKAAGISQDSLFKHYFFYMEYLWAHLQPKQSDQLTIVIDCEGLGLMSMNGECASFLKGAVSLLSVHYPQRSYKILVLNAPSFFSSAYALFKPLLNTTTKRKIMVVPKSQMAAQMTQIIAPENLPVQYGGKCTIPLGQSPAECSIRSYVISKI